MRKVRGLYDICSLHYDSLLFLFSVVFLTIAQRSNPVETALTYFPLLSKAEPVCVQQAASLKASYERHHSHGPKCLFKWLVTVSEKLPSENHSSGNKAMELYRYSLKMKISQ